MRGLRGKKPSGGEAAGLQGKSSVKPSSSHQPGKVWLPWDGCEEVAGPEGDICQSACFQPSGAGKTSGWLRARNQRWEVMAE